MHLPFPSSSLKILIYHMFSSFSFHISVFMTVWPLSCFYLVWCTISSCLGEPLCHSVFEKCYFNKHLSWKVIISLSFDFFFSILWNAIRIGRLSFQNDIMFAKDDAYFNKSYPCHEGKTALWRPLLTKQLEWSVWETSGLLLVFQVYLDGLLDLVDDPLLDAGLTQDVVWGDAGLTAVSVFPPGDTPAYRRG